MKKEMSVLTEAEIMERFRQLMAVPGAQTRLAKSHGLSTGMVSLVANGKAKMTDRIAGTIGYRRVSMYVPK